MYQADTGFAGSIPELYDRYMVPLMFDAYALDLAARVNPYRPSSVLEIAAGTGAATRQLARTLPAGVRIVATDLNQAMIDYAGRAGTARPVEWRQADVMQLGFPDGAFDVVICQFGAMFFPDKPRAYAEIRRVLAPQGRFIFNVWDRIEDNEFTATVEAALQACFPHDPPRFMSRVPHGYWDTRRIEQDLRDGGFDGLVDLETVAARSCADTPRIPAIALCQGTPLRNEIESRDGHRLDEVTEAAASALASRFGAGRVEGKIQAHVVVAAR